MAEKRLVAYYGYWAMYRPDDGECNVEDIEAGIATHLVYSYVTVTTDGEIKIEDSVNIANKGIIQRFNELKHIPGNEDLKTMVAIGGRNMGQDILSQVVNDSTLRSRFVDNITNFVHDKGFDGFSLDWNYPTDKRSYSKLLKNLRERFDEYGFILSATVSAKEEIIDASYVVPDVAEYCDFINIQAYELYDPQEMVSAIHSPLKSTESCSDHDIYNVESAMNNWIDRGAPEEKLNLAIITYGITFNLADPKDNIVGAPITGPGTPGIYTREERGVLGYFEICEQMRQGKLRSRWDDEHNMPYAFGEGLWVTYEDTQSLTEKAEYIKEKGLGGAMVWAVEHDDFRGLDNNGKYPLLSTLKSALME